MPYYNVCDLCGATLDPGEKCTCVEDAKRERREAETKKAVAFTMQLLNGPKKRKKVRR